MKRDLWPMRDSVKDYFPLPKEIFSLGLSAAEIAIYAYLWFSTAEHYRCEVEQQIIPRLGDVPLKKLADCDLQWLYKGLQEHRRLCKGRRRVRISLQIRNGRCADEGNALCLKARDIVFGNVPVRDDPVHAVRRRDLDQRIVPEF